MTTTEKIKSLADKYAIRLKKVTEDRVLELNNHQLKLVGLNYGLEVRIRVDLTTRLMEVPS